MPWRVAPGVHVDAEFVADRLQQFGDGQFRIEDVRDIAVGGHLLEKAAADRGLAGADLAGQQDEAAAAADAVQQMRQRLAMTFAHEQVARIGRDRKRRLLQTEKMGVHGRQR